MQVTITIDTAEVLRDIRTKSMHEVQALDADEQTKYKFQAGNDKNDELYRCLQYAEALLRGQLGRFVSTDISQAGAVNEFGIPDNYVYRLNISERRADGLATMLAELIHDYLVSATLTRFYTTVGAAALAQTRAKISVDTGNMIAQQIYTKKPPII